MKLNYDELLSNFAFNCNPRRYLKVVLMSATLNAELFAGYFGGTVQVDPRLTPLAFNA